MTNAKIEKIDAAIVKTRAKLSAYHSKLRDLERQRRIEEDAEIVARFRADNLTDNDLALLREMKCSHVVIDENPQKEEPEDDEI